MTTARLIAVSAMALMLAASPVRAQDEAEPRLSDRLEELMRELIDEMRPAIDELQETLEIFEKIPEDFRRKRRDE